MAKKTAAGSPAKTKAAASKTAPTSNNPMTIAEMAAHLRALHGEEIVQLIGSQERLVDLPVISTGSVGLDHALGIGGFPRKRIVEIFGGESAGKTTVCLQVIANAQAAGGTCAFVDAEHALDVKYARKLGVKTGDLLISQPDYGEQALDTATSMCRIGIDVVVIDSVAALTPKAEIDGTIEDNKAGLGAHARLMSEALRKLAAATSKHGSLVIFTNQTRMKIGVSFGSPITTTGGNALKFYASQRVQVTHIGKVREGDVEIGARVRAKVVKNKVASPYAEAEYEITRGNGVDRYLEIIDIGTDAGIIDKAGAWFSFEGERIGQGRQNCAIVLRENKAWFSRIQKKVVAFLKTLDT